MTISCCKNFTELLVPVSQTLLFASNNHMQLIVWLDQQKMSETMEFHFTSQSAWVSLTLLIFANFYFKISIAANPLASYNLVYGWKQLDYKFPSEQFRNRVLSTEEFIPKNNVITGIKVYGTRIYLTVPRWRLGVPATLVYVDFNPDDIVGTLAQDIKAPALNPYPSWEMNQIGNCNGFQYVQSMEIDQFGRMWIVDVGRVNIFVNRTEVDNKCRPKIVLIDIASGNIIRSYEFPKEVVSSSNFLNDIAVACTAKEVCIAYISDALESKIVVYNYAENRSWYVHHSSMVANFNALNITILGKDYQFKVNVDGLAVSPKDTNFDRLYYCPLSSLNLFSVPTASLRTAVNGDNLPDSAVTDEGPKSSQSDGLAMDAQGLLFYGVLGENGVIYYNTSSHSKVKDNEVLLVQNDVDLQWPDTFGFDDMGYMYTVTNRLQHFKGNSFDFAEVNFRIVRFYTGSQSYMYSSKSKVKKAPEIIPPSLMDATPMTNQDGVTDQNDLKADTKEAKSSSSKDNNKLSLDTATSAVLVLTLVIFAVHPVG